MAKTGLDPGVMLAQVNEAILETTTHGQFVTIVSGFFDPRTRAVVFACAGHPPPLYHRAPGDYRWFEAAAPPLGVVPGCQFPLSRFELSGGCLYLYTDGVIESEDDAGRPLGLEGLCRLIEKHAGMAPADRLARIVVDLKGERTPHDDITLMLLHGGAR
jgi:sigma-B regulation protein RsbU (phosphoserine phosphatase)